MPRMPSPGLCSLYWGPRPATHTEPPVSMERLSRTSLGTYSFYDTMSKNDLLYEKFRKFVEWERANNPEAPPLIVEWAVARIAELESDKIIAEASAVALVAATKKLPPSELTDDQIQCLIEYSDGHWKEDVFQIDGPALSALLRRARTLKDIE